MRTYTLSLIISSAIFGGTLGTIAERVQFNELPANVQRTINSQVGAAGIAAIDKSERNGVAFYEVRTSQAGAKPFYVSETGSVINPDNVISSRRGQDVSRKGNFAELPAPVQNTVRGQAGTAPVEDIDIVTKNGLTTYEVAFKREGKTVELVLDPRGQILSGAGPAAAPVSQTRVPLAAGSKATLEQLPAPVQNTLRTYTQGARIEDIDKGTLQGKAVYEAAFKHQGQHVELRVAEDGSLVRDDVNDRFLTSIGQAPGHSSDRVAAQSVPPGTGWQSTPSRLPLASARKVSFRELPSAVRNTLRTYAGDQPIEDVDQGTVGGQTLYQAAFKHNGQHVELRLAEDGTLVKDQVNARFLNQFSRQTTPSNVGRAPSWQILSGGQASASTQLSNTSEIRYDRLPAAVQNALRTQAGASAIENIRRGTLNGRTVYEATLIREGRDETVRLAEDGKLIR